MSQFMLALHDDPSEFQKLSPEEIQGVIEEYSAWAARLKEQDTMETGSKLKDGSGKVLRGYQSEMTVKDGPYSETKEILGGFFIIHADSYEDAAQISRDCPHLKYGGTIELRQVDLVD